MKIGILVTGESAEEIAENYGQLDQLFKDMFNPLEADIEWLSFIIHKNEFPKKADMCDAWIITGSKHGAYEDIPWISKLEDFIQDIVKAEKKLIGICFGHQIIAQALGGKVVKNPNGYGVGRHEYKAALPTKIAHLATSDKKTQVLPNIFQLNVLHGDQVVALPDSAEIIASSEFCEIAGLYYPEGILTFQGHPEFTPNFVNDLLRLRWKNSNEWVSKQRMDDALSNLSEPTERLSIANLLMNFMKDKRA